jgi:hypothetical protein
MWKNGLTSTEALDLIRAKRGFIDPNIGFIGQLMVFHDNLRGTTQPEYPILYVYTATRERIVQRRLSKEDVEVKGVLTEGAASLLCMPDCLIL